MSGQKLDQTSVQQLEKNLIARILSENHKLLKIVIKSYDTLNNRLDHLETRLDQLESKQNKISDKSV
jgi:hypothetical protein